MPPAWAGAEPQEMAQSCPEGPRCPCHPFPAPTLQAVPDRFKGCEQLPLSQGNIHMSNFMNLLKVLAEFVL